MSILVRMEIQVTKSVYVTFCMFAQTADFRV